MVVSGCCGSELCVENSRLVAIVYGYLPPFTVACVSLVIRLIIFVCLFGARSLSLPDMRAEDRC